MLNISQTIELQAFKAAAEALAGETMKSSGGVSYEVFAQRFTAACEPLLQELNGDILADAIKAAESHGYYDANKALESYEDDTSEFDIQVCSLSGIDIDYCHCGRHE